LDVGCGRPCETLCDFSFLKSIGGGVGVDLKGCAPAPEGSHFLRGDLLALPFAKESFSTVVALEVLEHVDDVDTALSNVRYVLKEGGVFIMSTPSNNLLWKVVWAVWVRTVGHMWAHTHKSNLTQRQWVERLGGQFKVTDVASHWWMDTIVRMEKA
jgi:2-polyprenyl-3-methyl-5-hydroxy-6-metoxy-1,4-benzoquinol methylase